MEILTIVFFTLIVWLIIIRPKRVNPNKTVKLINQSEKLLDNIDQDNFIEEAKKYLHNPEPSD